ncbi:MAG: Flp family type IVb pilin [Planctomycetales bacterium]|nr:Flp family type IVb pilin [Planctomycetales bacterium]
MKDFLIRLLREEDGPTAVEYAVMLFMIILAAIGSIRILGTNLNSSFENSNTELVNAFS